jgi:4-methylaminobutanoate oxidase (formaldehyde-forming)
VTKAPGRLTYTQLLNSRGGIECDLTVARLAADRFYLVTGTAFGAHDFHHIRRHAPAGLDVHLVDATSAQACLALMGPRARDVLAQVTDDDLTDAAFPFAAVRTIHIGGAPVIALRVTYVGELGWELHVPVESALGVYDLVKAAGVEHGLVDAGYRAIESLRLEKGYRAFASDLTPDSTPLEAGLGWAVKLRSDHPFLGREALETQKAAGLSKRMACFTVEDRDVVLLGRETIYRDGVRVGWLTSGGYGYTVDRPIGYGYVRGGGETVTAAWLRAGDYALEVATERVPAQLHLRALYDPKSVRVRG